MKNLDKQKIFSWVIFAQALIATLGSLYLQYFGDIARNISRGNLFPDTGGFEPCLFCWWARILMYPIVIIALVGILTKDEKWAKYSLALSVLGFPISFYHWLTQVFPGESGACGPEGICGRIYVEYFGFVTIPLMCWTAFLVIAIFSGLKVWKMRKS